MVSAMEFTQKVLKATLSKRQNEASIREEYYALEQVKPDQGSSWGQQQAMVKQGLCKDATWFKIFGSNYIATNGPMQLSNYRYNSNTCPDFWKMVWKTNTKIIVMLCQVQPGFTGCSEYFPMKSGDKM